MAPLVVAEIPQSCAGFEGFPFHPKIILADRAAKQPKGS